ncbi:unnamed protein product, partial [Amoebophrya sp. A25]|eukprot:GSA25T00020515001.1
MLSLLKSLLSLFQLCSDHVGNFLRPLPRLFWLLQEVDFRTESTTATTSVGETSANFNFE